MKIKKNYLVTKRNVLNELRSNNMTLQELRFFSIYLSKIDPRDEKTRLVKFPLTDFQKIMELSKIQLQYLRETTNGLLSKIVNIPLDEKGGYTAFQLFKECTVNSDEFGEWYVEIDAHDKALPLMFEFKEKYFSYQLWNALKLKSTNQLRMYEILKQYQKIGERILSIEELKSLLGINKNDYVRYNNFRADVLEVCKKSLEENTDIRFTYEPTGKKGRGGKILTLRFKIFTNNNHSIPISLEEFMDTTNYIDFIDYENNFDDQNLFFYSEACNHEFSEEEMQVLYNLAIKIVPYSSDENNMMNYYDYFKKKYDELNLSSKKTKINHRCNYLKKLFELDLKE